MKPENPNTNPQDLVKEVASNVLIGAYNRAKITKLSKGVEGPVNEKETFVRIAMSLAARAIYVTFSAQKT